MCVGNLPLEKKHNFCSVYIYLSFHLRQYSWKFELLTLKKKKMFCAFIDFEKAFATDWREG
jgi:hypothetical protein